MKCMMSDLLSVRLERDHVANERHVLLALNVHIVADGLQRIAVGGDLIER
jgi:hypothetical protein